MDNEVNGKWEGGMAFTAQINGHTILMDTGLDGDGQDSGPRPKALLLAGLLGCTAMDVISILKKMKDEPEIFRIETVGNLTTEHPKVYSEIQIRYIFGGKKPALEHIEKAVNLSMEKYCGVSAMLGKTAKITWEIAFE
jgi:putative redox protein